MYRTFFIQVHAWVAKTEKGFTAKAVNPLKSMVRLTGVEPVACRLGGGCSIQLSYRRV